MLMNDKKNQYQVSMHISSAFLFLVDLGYNYVV
jgi:hypothetical protein